MYTSFFGTDLSGSEALGVKESAGAYNTELKNAVIATEKHAQYDESAKRLLGNKYILAYILITTVEDFKGMSPREAMSYIVGEPEIGTVPIEPGLTNTKASSDNSINTEGVSRVVDFNNEDAVINEGLICLIN